MKVQLQEQHTKHADINSLHKDMYKTNGWDTTTAKTNYCRPLSTCKP